MSIKETDLWEPLERLLIASDMEIFKEVVVGGCRADVVCRQGKIVTVMEMKTSLSLQLMEQAYGWLGRANYVYCVVPFSRKRGMNSYARHVLLRDGIGIIGVRVNSYSGKLDEALVLYQARLQRKIKTKWDRYLLDIYKDQDHTPGSQKCGITPYKHMIEQVKWYMNRVNRPVTSKEIVEYVDTVGMHYVNPKSGIYQALTTFEKEWCGTTKIGGRIHFYIKQPRTPVL